MKKVSSDFAGALLGQARHSLLHYHLPRIRRCLSLLSEKQIWWRPHPTSNSVGNLVLHLAGNVRQWIMSSLGGAPDIRRRDLEFSARGPISRRRLVAALQNTTIKAGQVVAKLSPRDLARVYSIQGFRVTGFEAIFHVTEHFAYHTGQIIYVTKLKRGEDLGLTRLPGQKPKKPRTRNLSSI